MARKYSVSIGIPSYNEGVNIIRILNRLRRVYDGENYRIREVIIVDDSIDETPLLIEKYVRGLREKPFEIKYIHNDRRLGVGEAWNRIFRLAIGDIIVLIDADIFFDNDLIYRLVKRLTYNSKVGGIACRTIPIRSHGIASDASYVIGLWLNRVRESNPSTEYLFMGRCIALWRGIARRIIIPREIISIDLYLQLKILSLNCDVGFERDAKIYFYTPRDMMEHVSQVLRGYIGHRQLRGMINKYVNRGISLGEALIHLLYVLRACGLHSSINFLISLISLYPCIPLTYRGSSRYTWSIARSTKHLS